MIRRWFAVLLAGAMTIAHAGTPLPQSSVILPVEDRTALDAAAHALCGRQVALLGEAPTHGDGHTAAFKVALAQRLISRCRFSAIAFESGRYEFIAFDRALRRGSATRAMISDAVGGLWKFDREFRPLVGFLFSAAKAGNVRLAGLDAQLGGLGSTYTNEQMVPELTQGLGIEEAGICNAAFARHATGSYPPDRPYGPIEHERLLNCAAAMRRAVDTRSNLDPLTRFEQREMVENIERAIGPDLGTRAEQIVAREQWLFRNFTAFAETLPRPAKIIVWGATVHLAKDATAIPSAGERRTLGALIHDRYGDQAYTLGFSAGGGTYRVFRKLLPIDPPPASSLEARALATGKPGAIYLDRRRLRRLGVIPGAALEHAYRSADWAAVVDGVVIFREEWPTHSTRPGY